MATIVTALQFAISCQINLKKHHSTQAKYQIFLSRSLYSYHFYLYRHHVRQRSLLRRHIIRLWANLHLRVGFESFRHNAKVAKILLRACSYMYHCVFQTWRRFVLFDRAQEIAAYMMSDDTGCIGNLKGAFKRWRKGILLFRRERDLTRVAIHKYRSRVRKMKQLYQIWLNFIVKRRRARCRLMSVSSLWLRTKYRQHFDRWSNASRRIGVRRRRKLTDALALWAQATLVRCIRSWFYYVKKLKYDRKKALGRWRNKSISKCYQRWVEYVSYVKHERRRKKMLISRMINAMLHRYRYSGFMKWVQVIRDMKIMGNKHYEQLQELSPKLETLFHHVKRDVSAHDLHTKKFRQSWTNWQSPLDNAVQNIVIENSQHGKRWVAREIINDSEHGPGGGALRSSRAGIQVANSYREPLSAIGGGGGNGSLPRSTITLDGVSQEMLNKYRKRYKYEYKNNDGIYWILRICVISDIFKEQKAIL